MSAVFVGLLAFAGIAAVLRWVFFWADRAWKAESSVREWFAFAMGAGVPLGVAAAILYALTGGK